MARGSAGPHLELGLASMQSLTSTESLVRQLHRKQNIWYLSPHTSPPQGSIAKLVPMRFFIIHTLIFL